MNNRRRLILIAAATTILGCKPPTGQLIAAGLCEQQGPEHAYAQPDSAAGYATFTDLHIANNASTVVMKQGVAFGIEWKATDLPENARIKYIIEHPLITRPDGKQLRQTVEEIPIVALQGTFQTTDCYVLSEPHELVAGTWRMRVEYEGAVLAEKSFEVVKDSVL